MFFSSKSIRNIDPKIAREMIREFGLVSGSSFTNTEPSELCSEYHVMTGYWLPSGNGALVELTNKKDDDGKIVTTARVIIDEDSITESYSRTEKTVFQAQVTLNRINEFLGLDIPLPAIELDE